MFDDIDEYDYEALWRYEYEFEEWIALVEEEERDRVNVELRELAAESI